MQSGEQQQDVLVVLQLKSEARDDAGSWLTHRGRIERERLSRDVAERERARDAASTFYTRLVARGETRAPTRR